MRILIITGDGDVHAQAVAWGLGVFGEKVTIWKWSDFPRNDISSWQIDEFNDASLKLNIKNEAVLPPFDVIWNRRHVPPSPMNNSHPDDIRIILEESASYIRSIVPFLGTCNTLWVNPSEAGRLADNKILQLVTAKAIGFHIPATLVGNDAVKAKEFFDKYNGAIVFKAFRPVKWKQADGSIQVQGTARVSEEYFTNERHIRACPGIFQNEIEKEYEIRVTVIGEVVLAGAIYSQENGYTLDWRYDCGDTDNVPFNEIQLTEDVAEKCRELCRKLGLVFGCIDLIVAKTGETIFLEMNEGGQFLWKESLDPSMPMLDTFCRFLASRGNPNARPKQKRITRGDFYQSERWLATLDEIKSRGS